MTRIQRRRSYIPRGSRRATIKMLQRLRAHSRVTRRGFLAQTAIAASVLGLKPKSGGAQSGNVELRTLFFNLNSVDYDPAKNYYLYLFKQHYKLQKVASNPSVLQRARANNSFLRSLPDDAATHYVENAAVPTDITPLAYLYSPLDTASGTWSMSMVLQIMPASAVPGAFARLRSSLGAGPLPLSAKRKVYQMDPASTEQDLRDELDLVDYTDVARTLVTLHPDLVCAQPESALYIAARYVSVDAGTQFLSALLKNTGAAVPQQTTNQSNAQGWATLVPLNQDDGTPYKLTNGLNQYFPDWHSEVEQRVGDSVKTIHPSVKDDPKLGMDVTPFDPQLNNPSAAIHSTLVNELAGKIWYRHDGVTAVNHGAVSAPDAGAPAWAFRHVNAETGLKYSDPDVATQNGSVQVTFNNVSNWFLRYLGMYLQFVDRDGNVIPAASLPKNTLPDGVTPQLNRGNALFAGIVGPVFSVAGIPIYPPGRVSVIVNVPPDAATINVFYAGQGGSGSAIGPAHLWDVGFSMTMVFNIGLIALFMALGVSNAEPVYKAVGGVVGKYIAAELSAVLGAGFNGTSPGVPEALAMVKVFLGTVVSKSFPYVLEAIATVLVTAEIIDAIPVIGQIARVAAAIIGAAQLAVTSIELGISPPVYQFDLTFTHNLSLTIHPQAASFPRPPSGEVLYYKINYLFDNGSPHYLDGVEVGNLKNPIPINLTGIPWGGMVNISVGFYFRKSAVAEAPNDYCCAKGSTGLVSNTSNTAPDITIEQIKTPIQKSTVYIHTSKTTLDAQGLHRWTPGSIPPPYVPPSGGDQPGDLGPLRSITVRQSTAVNPGYVGYSWQSYSSGVQDCQSGTQGQLDMAANLNTDQTEGGKNAQNGYARLPCGLTEGGAGIGVNVAYNLLTSGGANFYVDPSTLMLRQVQLDPTVSFASPVEGMAFGQLNLDSTALLLHPAGHVVSINHDNHKFEALKLPASAVVDKVAQQSYLARTYSGSGSLPGLMKYPVAACISAEGAILILEAGNNRIQAFDLGGNPVPYFKKQQSSHFLTLPATQGFDYLDLAVEFSGFLYVLSRNSDSGQMAFRLDIYHPEQSGTQPISTTKGMNAAKLAVDFWRNLYTLNYEVLKLPSGQIPPLTEPSVSFWMPSLP
ncbi:MAG: hypothetical protein JO108_25815 [Acidobacteriaceae bacterium]|nr:hypothetical protein [Acidobacteriaceae bacterium]